MALLYKQLEIQLSEKYVDSEDYLHLLAEKVEASDYLKSADIYIDGFHSFTPQEYEVVCALMKHAANVKIALTADKPYKEHLPHELHLFQMTGKTYNKLLNLALEEGKDVEEPLLLGGNSIVLFINH